nr:hypothetical protein [uncultured Rhodopila sp.]
MLIASLLGMDPDRLRFDDPAALRSGIAARRASDFAAGRITHLDGWVVALTEARAFALAALI